MRDQLLQCIAVSLLAIVLLSAFGLAGVLVLVHRAKDMVPKELPPPPKVSELIEAEDWTLNNQGHLVVDLGQVIEMVFKRPFKDTERQNNEIAMRMEAQLLLPELPPLGPFVRFNNPPTYKIDNIQDPDQVLLQMQDKLKGSI